MTNISILLRVLPLHHVLYGVKELAHLRGDNIFTLGPVQVIEGCSVAILCIVDERKGVLLDTAVPVRLAVGVNDATPQFVDGHGIVVVRGLLVNKAHELSTEGFPQFVARLAQSHVTAPQLVVGRLGQCDLVRNEVTEAIVVLRALAVPFQHVVKGGCHSLVQHVGVHVLVAVHKRLYFGDELGQHTTNLGIVGLVVIGPVPEDCPVKNVVDILVLHPIDAGAPFSQLFELRP